MTVSDQDDVDARADGSVLLYGGSVGLTL